MVCLSRPFYGPLYFFSSSQALNPLDMGHLLKKFMEEMTIDQRKDKASTQHGMVSDILKAFERQGGESADQVKQNGSLFKFVILTWICFTNPGIVNNYLKSDM